MIARGARSLGPSATTASPAMFASARSAAGSSASRRSPSRTSTPDLVRRRVALRRLDGLRVEVDPHDRREPELGGRDREDTRAAAHVEHAAALLRLEQLEAQPRRGMSARAERAARIDHDRDRVLVGRLPGRADPEAADPLRPMELPPALLPVVVDVGGARGTAEGLPDALLAGRIRVRGQLERAVSLQLLEPLGEELQHDRARLLRPRVGNGHRHPPEDHRRALNEARF